MDDVTFFFDRSLGLHAVPGVFEDAGLEVVRMRDMYSGGRDQEIGDDEWILDVAAAGLVAVTKDANIVKAHAPAIAASRIRMFTFPNANMTGGAMAERARTHLASIVARATDAGPFVDGIYADGLRSRWPA